VNVKHMFKEMHFKAIKLIDMTPISVSVLLVL